LKQNSNVGVLEIWGKKSRCFGNLGKKINVGALEIWKKIIM